MRRILISATLTSGLLLASAVPLLGTASAAACPSWTDPTGDAGLTAQGTVVAEDESLDITSVKVEQTSSELIVTFGVPQLSRYNAFTSGDRFRLAMSAGGTTASVFTDRDDYVIAPKSGVLVGNSSYLGGWSSYDVDGKKVVITMPHSVLTTALGKPFAGLALSSFVASVWAQASFNGRAPLPGASASYTQLETAAAPADVALVGGTACAGAVGSPAMPAVTTGALPSDAPAAGCFHTVDDTGDAHPINGNVPNDPDLDITGVTYRTTGDWFLAYVKVAALAAGPQVADGHRFSVDFTFNKHTFTISASSFKNAQSATLRDTIASTGAGAKTVQLTVDAAPGTNYHTAFPPFVDSGSTAVFDTDKSLVTLAVPVADIQKYGRAPFSVGTLEAVNAKTAADYWRNSFIADYSSKTNATSTDKWVVGDNRCFTIPTKLALSVLKTRSTRTVTAKLTTAAGHPIGNRNVVFAVNGRKVATAKTDAFGAAVLRNVKAGSTVKATSAAGSGYLASSATKKV